jgi:hypothetical protein
LCCVTHQGVHGRRAEVALLEGYEPQDAYDVGVADPVQKGAFALKAIALRRGAAFIHGIYTERLGISSVLQHCAVRELSFASK